MRNVWMVKYFEWNDDEDAYQKKYSQLYGSKLKARRSAIEYITLILNERKIKTNEYSKEFFTVSGDDGLGHCVISKEPVF